LRQWKFDLPEIHKQNEIMPERDWFVNSVGSTMLRIRPVPPKTLDEYWVADCEVTRGQYEQLIVDEKFPATEKPDKWPGIAVEISPTAAHPAQQISWYDAVMYCNWISLKEGRSPCYRRTGTKEMDYRKNEHDGWEEIPGATGYRLLHGTEWEWEYASRAGTQTEFSIGNEEMLLSKYCQMSPAKMSSIVGSKLPNAWGFHDMHGNVWEWCFDGYKVPDGLFRASRGGGWNDAVAHCRSAYRSTDARAFRYYGMGFRLALSPSNESSGKQAKPSGVGTEGATAEQRPELP